MTAIQPKTDASTITVRNPAHGRVVGAVSIETFDAVAAKARELRMFQPEWEALGPRGRKRWLLTYQDWVLDNAEHITDVVQSETGKTRANTSFEPPCVANLLDYWAGHAQRFLPDEHPRSFNPLAVTKKLTTAYRPYRREAGKGPGVLIGKPCGLGESDGT
jgi:acyl-CoA reductase-like NAD-dependent aldehyde dehydrogenase